MTATRATMHRDCTTGATSSPTRPKDTIPSATHRCYYTDFLAERRKLQVYEDCARNFRLGQSTGFLRPWEHLPNLLEEDEHIDAYIADTASEWIRSHGTTGRSTSRSA